MALSSSSIKEVLAKESLEFKKLYETHKDYDERLLYLNKRPFLSAAEEMEIMELKKKKLIHTVSALRRVETTSPGMS